MTIQTTYDPKPIPTRSFDWMAYVEGTLDEGCKLGWGATEAEAIEELKEALE